MPSKIRAAGRVGCIPNPAATGGTLSSGSVRSQRCGLRALAECCVVFLAAVAFYVSLYGELPYHDAARFIAQVESGRFVWDIAHIFLQPTTLLWHQYLGFGEMAEASQKHINTFATALGLAVFYYTLLRIEFSLPRRIAATILVAVSFGLMTLAPSSHMKMLAFPMLNGALLFGVLWERTPSLGSWRGHVYLLAMALLLAFAASLLASNLAVAPFVAAAIGFNALRRGDSPLGAFGRATEFAVVCGVLFVGLAIFGYVSFSGQKLTLDGLVESVSVKNRLLLGYTSVSDAIGRAIFGTANNFVAAPDLGAVVRAWLDGQILSLVPYVGKIVSHLGPWLVTTGLISAIYLNSALQLMRGASGLIPFAFLCGAHSWTIYCNLNDPEHWYALTVPTVVLFLTHFPDKIVGIVLPIWAAATAVLNLAFVGIPMAQYPLRAAEAEVRREFNGRDLLVYFAAYPGKPYLGFFRILELETLQLDTAFLAAGSEAEFFETLDRSFHETWDRGGKVMVFDILDPNNWNAPWMVLKAANMPKSKLVDYITSHYVAVPLPDLAGLKVWRLDPRAASDETGPGRFDRRD